MNYRALGIDIGGTKIAAALVGADGAIAHKVVVPTPAAEGGAAVLQAATAAGRQVMATAETREVVGVGVGTSGHVDYERAIISYASAILPGWGGIDIRRQMHEVFGLPVTVDNDVNAMAIGEARFGAGRGLTDVLYITVGTGIGGALMFDGKLRRGASWTAGELAHLVIDWNDGRLCNCGDRGHLEAYVAGPAMVETWRSRYGHEAPEELTFVAKRARDGDAIAAEVIAQGARILGQALGGLLNVLDPQALIVGGGVAELGDLWWPHLEAALRANRMPGPARVPLHRALLGVDAVLIGAGWLALSEVGEICQDTTHK